MSAFKFKIENNQYIWENNDIRLAYSSPSIQPFNSYLPISSENNIMYLYYDISIYNMKEEYIDNDEDEDEIEYTWELVTSRSVYDFPTIRQLKAIIEEIINLNIKKDGQRVHCNNGEIRYRYQMSTYGFACDDFYEISKESTRENNSQYTIYIGTTFDNQGDLNSKGIRTPYLDENDLNELLKCVNSFLKHAINLTNESIMERINYYHKKFEIKNNKLFAYKQAYTNLSLINFNEIQCIFTAKDKIDVDIVYKEGYEYKHKNFRNVYIKEIKDNKIILNNNEEINPDNIVSLFYEANHKVEYDMSEILNDFISIFSENELLEIKKLTHEEIYKKYGNVFIDRNWMMRNEHKYPNPEKLSEIDSIRFPYVNSLVKEMIKELKGEKI